MKKCNVCGNPIPDDCTACPYCAGSKPAKKPKKPLSTAATVIIAISIVVACLASLEVVSLIQSNNDVGNDVSSAIYQKYGVLSESPSSTVNSTGQYNAVNSSGNNNVSNYSGKNNTVSSASSSNNQGSAKSSSAAPSKAQGSTGSIYKYDGMYKVGTDIPAGLYYFETKSDDYGYYEIDEKDSGKSQNIINNDIVDTFGFFDVSAGQYVTVRGGCIAPANNVPKIQPQNGVYGEGTYRVGIDIPAGEYNIIAERDAEIPSYTVLNDVKGGIDAIADIAFVEGNKYVTVKTGQFLKIKDAYIIAK